MSVQKNHSKKMCHAEAVSASVLKEIPNLSEQKTARVRNDKSVEIFKIDGVGVNLSRFHPCTLQEKKSLRAELGYSENDFVITVVAELNKNKNQIMLVRAVPELAKIIPGLKILLIGKETLPIVREFVQKENLEKYVEFLGYRRDVEKLTMMSDVAFSASIREGQGLNLVEAMACGLPVVASNIRGHRDVINNGWNGILCDLSNQNSFHDAIILLYKNPSLREEMGRRNVCEAKKYSVDIAVRKMAGIYKEVISENVGGGDNCRVVFQFCLPSFLNVEAA